MDLSKYSKYLSVTAILSCEFCERLAAFGIGSSLTLFLRSKLGYTTESATVWTAVWGAFATIFSLLGGYLSDRYFGRKKTILIGAIIYFVSLLCVSIITYIFELTDDLHLDAIEAIFWIALYVLSIGGGSIKANVGVFGADQLFYIRHPMADDNRDEDQHFMAYDVGSAAIDLHDDEFEASTMSSAEMTQSYWNWFYFAINAGALIAYTLVSYICQDISFSLGWSIPTVSMFIAILIFLSRSNYYHEPHHDASMIDKFVGVSYYALKNRHKKDEIAHDFQQNVLNNLNADDYGNRDEDENTLNLSWLDVAKIKYTGEYDNQFVEEVKSVYAVFGFLPFMVLYWVVYAAMNSLFYSQGCQMNYVISDSFDFPIAALNDADIIIILILVPMMDRLIYPSINRTGCCRFTMLKKIGVGYFILALAMLCAGLIEVWRKASTTLSTTSTCDSSIYISDLSVLWQIPQYFLCGVSEVFASIVSLEFFAGQAPESMKSIVYATNLVVIGIGSLISALLVFLVDLGSPEWIPNDLDNGYLENYFFLITGIMIATLIGFIPYAKTYEYKPGTDASNMNLADIKYKSLETEIDEDDKGLI